MCVVLLTICYAAVCACVCVCICPQLIHLLELDHVADWLVGMEETGIPRGERKRYTIGVELVTNPSVLFLGMWPLYSQLPHTVTSGVLGHSS